MPPVPSAPIRSAGLHEERSHQDSQAPLHRHGRDEERDPRHEDEDIGRDNFVAVSDPIGFVGAHGRPFPIHY